MQMWVLGLGQGVLWVRWLGVLRMIQFCGRGFVFESSMRFCFPFHQEVASRISFLVFHANSYLVFWLPALLFPSCFQDVPRYR